MCIIGPASAADTPGPQVYAHTANNMLEIFGGHAPLVSRTGMKVRKGCMIYDIWFNQVPKRLPQAEWRL